MHLAAAHPPLPLPLRRRRGHVSVAAGASLVGRRGTDEDDLLLYAGVGAFGVADGVGGVPGGCVASTTALRAIAESAAQRRTRNLLRRAKAAVADARLAIAANREFPTMATTLAFLLVDRNHAVACHLGDSRIYRMRRGDLELLTEDHSVASELRRAGFAVPPRARGMLTRCLQGHTKHEPAYLPLRVEPDDRFLITSDGVTDVLSDREIVEALRAEDPNAALADLLALVQDHGAKDDATAVIVDPGRLCSELSPDTQETTQIPDPTEPA